MRAAHLFTLSLIAACPAAAAVADSAANGFTVKISIAIAAPPDEVYQKLVHNIGDWWSPQHTFSRDSHNLTIDARPMGCWCEKFGAAAVRHMEVIAAVPGKALVMLGAVGPLQAMAVTGSMSFDFAADKGGTKLDVTYAVGGYLAAGLNTLANPVDAALAEQLTRLKNFVEIGRPVPPTQ